MKVEGECALFGILNGRKRRNFDGKLLKIRLFGEGVIRHRCGPGLGPS